MYGNERGASPGRPRLRRLMAGTLGGASAAKRRAVEVKRKPEKGRWKRKPAVAALGSKVRVVAKPNPPKLPTGRSDSNKPSARVAPVFVSHNALRCVTNTLSNQIMPIRINEETNC